MIRPRIWDGTRVLAIKDGEIILQNRHGIIYTLRLRDIVKDLKPFRGSWAIDGEIVYINPKTGEEQFTPSQRRCSTQLPDPFLEQQYPVTFEVFDVLQADKENLERWPYSKRKECLGDQFSDDDGILMDCGAIQYVPFERDLVKAWNEVIDKNREGLIAKQVDSAYVEGDRSYEWLKVKNWQYEVCDVVGFTPGERSRSHFFGSLVLEHEGKFRGCAGSGLNEWELRHFKDMFSDAPRVPKPVSDEQVGAPYTAARLKTQVLVRFYQMTENNVMRFPIFVTSN